MTEELERLRKENEELKREIEKLKSVKVNQRNSMINKASQGNLMSRAAFGYKIENGKLIPAENSKEIEEIFEEFLSQNISLRQLSEKHHLSVNGLKKISKKFYLHWKNKIQQSNS